MLKEPDRELVPGVEVETDLGTWQVHETPGHAPSHVVLHQPERKLLISGDHLLGRTVLFFDYGHSPDPVGEFLASLDEVEPLDVDLVLPGHGRTFRDPEAKIAESRRQVDELLGKVRGGARRRRERTAFEIVAEIIGPEMRQHPGQRLGPADRPLLPRPPGDRRRGRAGRGHRPAALGLDVAFRRWRASHTSAQVAAPPETVFDVLTDHRRYTEITPLRKAELEREGEPAPNGLGAIRVLSARSGPPMREEVIAYEPPSRFSYKILSGAAGPRPRRHRRAEPDGGGTEVIYAVRTTPTLPLVGAVFMAILKQAIKDLIGGVAKESERRAANGEGVRRFRRLRTPIGCCASARLRREPGRGVRPDRRRSRRQPARSSPTSC